MSSSRDILDKLDLARKLSAGGLQDHRRRLLDALAHRLVDELDGAHTKMEQLENNLDSTRREKEKVEQDLRDAVAKLSRWKRVSLVATTLAIASIVAAVATQIPGNLDSLQPAIACADVTIEYLEIHPVRAKQPIIHVPAGSDAFTLSYPFLLTIKSDPPILPANCTFQWTSFIADGTTELFEGPELTATVTTADGKPIIESWLRANAATGCKLILSIRALDASTRQEGPQYPFEVGPYQCPY